MKYPDTTVSNFILSSFLIFFLAFGFEKVKAQTSVDTSFSSQMNYIFSNLEKNRIPYGILRDYGMEFTELNQFNGAVPLVDSNRADINTFWDVYNTLVMSRIHSSASGFTRPGLLDTNWYNTRQYGRITLMGLYFNYSRFKDDAANNTVTVSNGRLYDKYVSGVWQNPYQSEKTFVVSPSVTEYDGKTFELLLPANLWSTNNTQSYTLSVNVNDGAGYRTLTLGTPLNISYADTGYYEWTYRMTIAGLNYFSHSKVRITNNSGNSSAALQHNNVSPALNSGGQTWKRLVFNNVKTKAI